ncbi:MAG: tyrosine-type recombinase/integrase [Bacilli bacterium]|nr:tyrosine-type recombinase/integrase [Bacilli bacterium]MDD3895642.1 tyrosine-type recombinase/integrase [Bacilli bacterium]MDD4407695.1 tyrosine-type recombinase/integrase [Bacilli bacterium]
MKDIIYEFLDYISLERKYSNNTEINYEIDLFKYDEYLTKEKKNYLLINYQDISKYIVYLRKANYLPSSINRNLSTLRSFYNFLERKEIINNNPFNYIKNIKQEKKLPNYFKYNEFITMLETLNDDHPLNVRNRLILELLFATGIRVSELVNIKINNIDIGLRQIKVSGKGNKERIVYFGSYCEDAIKNYFNNARDILLKDKISPYLFINNRGGNLTDRGIRLIIDNIIKASALKIKITPHTFRHSFATIMLNEGCNIKSVQELLGHVSINTTSIYTHLTNEEIRRVYLNAHPRAKK